MRRRQFLKAALAIPAVAIAGIGVAKAKVLNISGTVTGRFTSKQLRFAYLYGYRGMGKTLAADCEVYRRCLANQDQSVLRVESGQSDPLQWKTIQYGNQNFAELERRVLAHMQRSPINWLQMT